MVEVKIVERIWYYLGISIILIILLIIFTKLFFINQLGVKWGIIMALFLLLGIILMFIPLILEKIKFKKRKKLENNDNNEEDYYPPREYPGRNSMWIREENLGMKFSAKELENYITSTSPDETTFIGIEGEWGSGKTWLIKYTLENLENNKWVKIEFNPWLHTTPNKLKIDFITTIADGYGKATGRALSRWSSAYVNLISSISETKPNFPFLNWFLKLFTINLKSSPSAAKEFGEWIEEGCKRLVVYIQDIDRCEREMILSLLRLLRESELWKGVVVLIEYNPMELESKIVDLHKYIDIHLKYTPSPEGKIDLFIKGIDNLLKKQEKLNNQERKILEELKDILVNPQYNIFYKKNIINIIKTTNLRIIRKILIDLPFIVRRTFTLSLNIYHFSIIKFYELSFPEIFEYFFRMLYYNDDLQKIIETDPLLISVEKVLKEKKNTNKILEDKFEELKRRMDNKLENKWEKIKEFFENLGFFNEEIVKKEKNAFWSLYKIKYYLSPLSSISSIEEFEKLLQLFENNEVEEIVKFITNKIQHNEIENLIYTLKEKWNVFKKKIEINKFQNTFVEILNHQNLSIMNDEFFKLIEIFMFSIDDELPERLQDQDIEKYFNKFNPLVARIKNLYWRALIFYRIKEKLVWKLRDFEEKGKKWQECLRQAYREQFNKFLEDVKKRDVFLPEENSDFIESILLLFGGASELLKKEKIIDNWVKIIETLKESGEESYKRKGEELEEIIKSWENIEEEFFKFHLQYKWLDEIFRDLKIELEKKNKKYLKN